MVIDEIAPANIKNKILFTFLTNNKNKIIFPFINKELYINNFYEEIDFIDLKLKTSFQEFFSCFEEETNKYIASNYLYSIIYDLQDSKYQTKEKELHKMIPEKTDCLHSIYNYYSINDFLNNNINKRLQTFLHNNNALTVYSLSVYYYEDLNYFHYELLFKILKNNNIKFNCYKEEEKKKILNLLFTKISNPFLKQIFDNSIETFFHSFNIDFFDTYLLKIQEEYNNKSIKLNKEKRIIFNFYKLFLKLKRKNINNFIINGLEFVLKNKKDIKNISYFFHYLIMENKKIYFSIIENTFLKNKFYIQEFTIDNQKIKKSNFNNIKKNNKKYIYKKNNDFSNYLDFLGLLY